MHGAGSSVITVEGGVPPPRRQLCRHGRPHRSGYLPGCGGLRRRTVEVTGVDYRHLSTVSAVLREAGCDVQSGRSPSACAGTAPSRGAAGAHGPPLPHRRPGAAHGRPDPGKGCTVFVENIFEPLPPRG